MDAVDILINDEQGDLDVSEVYITRSPININSDEDAASEDEGGMIHKF